MLLKQSKTPKPLCGDVRRQKDGVHGADAHAVRAAPAHDLLRGQDQRSTLDLVRGTAVPSRLAHATPDKWGAEALGCHNISQNKLQKMSTANLHSQNIAGTSLTHQGNLMCHYHTLKFPLILGLDRVRIWK